MASCTMGRCLCFFFILSLSFSLQTHARDSKFFSKFSHQQTTKNTKEVVDTPESNGIGISPTQSPAPAPALDSTSVVVERGYGLYGGENYRYPPMTVDPVKTGFGVGKEKRFVSMEELRNERNGNGNEKQGMSDTRFLENGRYYYDINQDVEDGNRNQGNGYETEKQGVSEHVENDQNSYPENHGNGNGNGNGNVTEKQGMSDTRFLENGRYYYDVNRDIKDENRYEGNNGYVTEKEGMSHENVMDEPENQERGNGNEYVTEKQGMSDTRYSENGKYYHDVNRDENTYKGNGYVSENQGMSTQIVDENIYPENQGNGYKNGYVTEKQGMSDTRFLENGRYYYDVNNDVKNENTYPRNKGHDNGNKYVSKKQGMSDTKFLENWKYDVNTEVAKGGNGHSSENNNANEYFETEENKFDNRFDNNNYENENFLNNNNGYEKGYKENEHYGGNNNGYMTHERRDNNYNPNEYMTQGREEYNGNTKKLPPNQYDTMEEYEKEEEYRLSHQYQP